MNRLSLITLTALLLAGFAQAGTIADIRAGLVPDGTVVTVEGAVVTAVMNNSITVAELPGGPNLALWVITDGAPTVALGDVVDLYGTYLEHNERATLSLWSPAEASITVTGSAEAPLSYVTVAQLVADPEAWESVVVFVTDGLIVQELFENGEWGVTSHETADTLVLNDYFGLFPDVSLGECYNNALGVFFRFQGQHVLKLLEVEYTECSVGNDALGFSALKTLFR